MLFRQYDKTGDGVLDLAEFVSAVRRVLKLPPSRLSDDDIEALFAMLDADRGGAIDLGEFLAFLGTAPTCSSTRRSRPRRRPRSGGGGGVARRAARDGARGARRPRWTAARPRAPTPRPRSAGAGALARGAVVAGRVRLPRRPAAAAAGAARRLPVTQPSAGERAAQRACRARRARARAAPRSASGSTRRRRARGSPTGAPTTARARWRRARPRAHAAATTAPALAARAGCHAMVELFADTPPPARRRVGRARARDRRRDGPRVGARDQPRRARARTPPPPPLPPSTATTCGGSRRSRARRRSSVLLPDDVTLSFATEPSDPPPGARRMGPRAHAARARRARRSRRWRRASSKRPTWRPRPPRPPKPTPRAPPRGPWRRLRRRTRAEAPPPQQRQPPPQQQQQQQRVGLAGASAAVSRASGASSASRPGGGRRRRRRRRRRPVAAAAERLRFAAIARREAEHFAERAHDARAEAEMRAAEPRPCATRARARTLWTRGPSRSRRGSRLPSAADPDAELLGAPRVHPGSQLPPHFAGRRGAACLHAERVIAARAALGDGRRRVRRDARRRASATRTRTRTRRSRRARRGTRPDRLAESEAHRDLLRGGRRAGARGESLWCAHQRRAGRRAARRLSSLHPCTAHRAISRARAPAGRPRVPDVDSGRRLARLSRALDTWRRGENRGARRDLGLHAAGGPPLSSRMLSMVASVSSESLLGNVRCPDAFGGGRGRAPRGDGGSQRSTPVLGVCGGCRGGAVDSAGAVAAAAAPAAPAREPPRALRDPPKDIARDLAVGPVQLARRRARARRARHRADQRGHWRC